jgi:hypothetical protein
MSSSSRVLQFETFGIIDTRRLCIPWKGWKLIILHCSVTSQKNGIPIRAGARVCMRALCVCVCVCVCVCQKMYPVSALLDTWFSTYTETLRTE